MVGRVCCVLVNDVCWWVRKVVVGVGGMGRMSDITPKDLNTSQGATTCKSLRC